MRFISLPRIIVQPLGLRRSLKQLPSIVSTHPSNYQNKPSSKKDDHPRQVRNNPLPPLTSPTKHIQKDDKDEYHRTMSERED